MSSPSRQRAAAARHRLALDLVEGGDGALQIERLLQRHAVRQPRRQRLVGRPPRRLAHGGVAATPRQRQKRLIDAARIGLAPPHERQLVRARRTSDGAGAGDSDGDRSRQLHGAGQRASTIAIRQACYAHAVEAPYGRYELVRPLDRGGMGEVWLARARGPERVHKTVVLKRIRGERASDDAARAHFADEARVAVSLSHPHIVPVFEFGELDGAYFLVMEWLRGGNLGRVAGVDRAPLPWPAVALIGTQLCDALAYVHARTNHAGARLVHGDVTPRNVLFSTEGHALLADFGLARFAGRGRAGTVRYQAPEQARGDDFDARADLYALALVLAEAATGAPAYDRDPARAARQARVGVIPDFAGCDDGLAGLLRRALSASADGRFADAAAMRAAFEALLDREPGARAAGRTEMVVRCATAGERRRRRSLARDDAGDARGDDRRAAGARRSWPSPWPCSRSSPAPAGGSRTRAARARRRPSLRRPSLRRPSLVRRSLRRRRPLPPTPAPPTPAPARRSRRARR